MRKHGKLPGLQVPSHILETARIGGPAREASKYEGLVGPAPEAAKYEGIGAQRLKQQDMKELEGPAPEYEGFGGPAFEYEGFEGPAL